MRFNTFAALAASIVAFATVPSVGHAQNPSSDDPYFRYVSPSQCMEGAQRMTWFYWRDKHKDTVRYMPQRDSAPRSVRDSLAQCATRFSAETVPQSELLPLLQLSVVTLDTVKANAAAERMVAEMAALPEAKRPFMLMGIVRAFLAGEPAQIAKAQHYLKRLDAMGAPAATERMLAHAFIGNFGLRTGDLELAESETKSAIVASRQMGRVEQFNMVDSIIYAYAVRSQVVSMRQGAKAAIAFIDTAVAATIPMFLSGAPDQDYRQAVGHRPLMVYRTQYESVGREARPVRGERWWGAGSDTVFPKPGRVTLTVVLNPYGLDFLFVATLRRLQNEYKARGMDMVIMTRTTGYFFGKIKTPAEEINNWERWFSFLRVPAPVALDETQFSRTVDGRRSDSKTANEKAYDFGSFSALVGKDGKVRYAGWLNVYTEQQYRLQIESALAQSL